MDDNTYFPSYKHQEILNEDTEEKLIAGLQRAAKQILEEHGYGELDDDEHVVSDGKCLILLDYSIDH